MTPNQSKDIHNSHTKIQRPSAPFITLLLTISLVMAGCSFGQASPEAEAAPVELETYQSPSAADSAADSTSMGEGNGSDNSGGNSNEAAAQSSSSQQNTSTATNTQIGSDARQSISLITQSSYNGEIEPDDTVTVMAEVSGKVLEVMVEEGDQVTAGQLLVRIDGGLLEAQQAQATAGLKAAQAQLDLVQVAPDAELLAAAEAGVNAAQVAYNEALKGATSEDIAIGEAQVRQAEAAVRVAQAAYNEVKGNPKIAAMPQSMQLEQATLGLEAAKAQFQKILNGAPDDAIARAYSGLVQAQTQLTNLQQGASEEQVAAVEAQIEQAEAGLYLATLQASKTTVAAPMDGIVINKNVAVGSMAAPGAPVVVIMSNDVNITIPVEESKMAQLALGQPALIQVNAYPTELFEGEIIRIAPQLDPSTRTVKVTIRPTNDTENKLVPGMFATVDLLN